MPTADDFLTGKASLDDLLGTPAPTPAPTPTPAPAPAPAGRPTRMTPTEVVGSELPVEAGPGMLPEAMGNVGAPDTTTSGLTGAVIRGAGPIALSALTGAGLALATGGAVLPAAAVMGAAPLVGDLGLGVINRMFNTDFTTPTEAFQHLFTYLGVPEAKSNAEKIVESSIRAGSEAATSAGVFEALATRMPAGSYSSLTRASKDLAQSLAENVPQQVAAAATGGAAAETARQMGAPEGAQFLAGLAGAVAGGKAASMGPVLDRRVGAAQKMSRAQEIGIEPMTSDVMPPQGMFGKFAQRVRESIPFTGTASKLIQQQEAKVRATKDILLEYGVDLNNPAIDRVTKDAILKREKQLTKYKKMQNEALNSAASSGVPDVPVPKTLKAVDNVIKMIAGTSAGEKLIPKLTDIVVRDLGGYKNIDNVEMFRQALRDEFTAPALSEVKTIAERITNYLYRHVKLDMEDFITKHGSPKDINKYRIANKNLHAMGKTVERRAFKNLLDNGDLTPEEAGKMLFSMKPSDVRALENALSTKGKVAARAAILEEAFKRMMKVSDKINPNRFAEELRKIGPSVGTFFKDEDYARANGFIEAMSVLQRSGEFNIMRPTGVVSQVPLFGGSLATLFASLFKGKEGAIGVASGILGTGLIGRAYESQAVRDILLKWPKYKKDPEKQLGAAQQLVAAIQAFVAKEQEQSNQESQ